MSSDEGSNDFNLFNFRVMNPNSTNCEHRLGGLLLSQSVSFVYSNSSWLSLFRELHTRLWNAPPRVKAETKREAEASADGTKPKKPNPLPTVDKLKAHVRVN